MTLTPEEHRALAVAAQGYSDTVAARHHGTSARTYRRHIASARDKLHARSLVHAVAIAATLRIIAVYPPGGAQ